MRANLLRNKRIPQPKPSAPLTGILPTDARALLSQAFEPDELQEVKTRLFPVVETPGRLNHPNFATIFDAGEEHDLAFIAIELLNGTDLTPHTKPGTLRSLALVMSTIARVADAPGPALPDCVVAVLHKARAKRNKDRCRAGQGIGRATGESTASMSIVVAAACG